MADNHVKEEASAGENGVGPTSGAVGDEGAGDSVDDQVNSAGSSNGNASHVEPTETRSVDDVGKDDDFVDCPDEIETSESQQNPEDKDSINGDQCNESDSGIKVQHLMDEIELLRDMHEKSVAEKENVAQERLEMQSLLHMKDQEIDFLNAKVAELSDSINIVQSNSTSTHENLSRLYEAQIEEGRHVEEIVNRILASISSTFHQEEFSNGSLTEKISNIENTVTFLAEKHNFFLSESDQLRRNEDNLYQNLRNLEDENRKLIEQLEKQRSILENANAEIGKVRAEAEQEKNRYLNTKEKLSMAVTKGKALVQQRDSLKQLLAEKTNQLEKCSVELQEKSSALEVAEQTKELVAASEKFASSLQESLTEKDMILLKCGEILSEGVAMEELQTTDIIEKLRWLVESFYLSKEEAVKLQSEIATTKEAANGEIEQLTTSLLAETQEKSYLQAELEDLRNQYETQERSQHELVEAREALNNEIDNLTKSLLSESQEKNYLQSELENLRDKYEEAVQKENLVSLEKDKIVNMLLEASGLANDGEEEVRPENSETATIIGNCLALIKEKALGLQSSQADVEKNYLQSELENLRNKYEETVQKENLVSLEKDKIVNMLLEASGLANDGEEEGRPENSETTTIIGNCLALIKEKALGLQSSQADVEIFGSFQSLLYIRDQEMSLYKLIVEEDILDRAEVSRLSGDLEMVNQELNALKQEKGVMQKSLEQLEDRCGLLKEKLSMAVKKGKGLFQERENLKGVLNEKNNEIDRLKSDLQQSLSTYNDSQDQITKLSLDVQRVSQLETDFNVKKEHADQLEQFLAESNSMLQRVMESIEGITTPADLVFEEPEEKVKWIAGYLSEHEIAKVEVEQELSKVKEEANSLASKLSEVQTMMNSLEDALSTAENKISQLLDEKKELEASKALLEEELEKEKDEASSHTSKFEEVSVSKRALEDALSLAENNISKFMNERDIAVENRALAENKISQLLDEMKELEVSKALLEEELQKEKEEASSHASKFEEVFAGKGALEDALSLAENNISRFMNERDAAVENLALAEEQLHKLKEEFSKHIAELADNEKTIRSLEEALSQAQIGRADLESEIKKMKEAAESHAKKISDASVTIKSLEDALVNAETNIQTLVQEKQSAEREILALNSRLESCMEELGGTRGSIENQSVELSGQLSRLQLLLKDETFSSLLKQFFEKNFESLNNMDFVLKEMGDCFLEMDSDALQNSPLVEDDSSVSTFLPSSLDIAVDMEMSNDEVNAVDSESMMFHIEKMNERFHLKSKILANKLEHVSTLMDESIAALLRRLHMTKDRIISIIRYTKSLKQQMEDMETDKQRHADTIASLESDVRILSSSCADATQGLESSFQENISALRSIHDLVKLDGIMTVDFGGGVGGDVETGEKLLFASRQSQDLNKLSRDAINKLTSIIEDMQKKLKETQLTYDGVLEERDLYRDKILKLETDLEAQRNLCNEMSFKLNDYREEEDKWRRKESELSTSLSKFHELEETLLSASQVKSILDKTNEVEVPDTAFAVGDSHESADVRKLFYVIDSFNGFQQKVTSLSQEKEELQSIVDEQILEIEHYKIQVENHLDNEKDSEKLTKLVELESGLRNIIHKLGGGDLMDDHKDGGEIWLLPLLDKLVVAMMMGSENLKSKNEELGAKLLGTQKVVDDLSNKVKLLEESNQARIVPPEMDQERGISVASLSTPSEISEIQEMATIGNGKNIPLVTSAAHARTMRKGSGDHLAINIDSDSERLLNNKESDEDKGHAFKSLLTSGLIPTQGRAVADRIDGYWVSGSRALMSRPRGRLGLIAYWLVLHIWLLGVIL